MNTVSPRGAGGQSHPREDPTCDGPVYCPAFWTNVTEVATFPSGFFS